MIYGDISDQVTWHLKRNQTFGFHQSLERGLRRKEKKNDKIVDVEGARRKGEKEKKACKQNSMNGCRIEISFLARAER